MRTKPHILRWLSIAVGMLFLTVAFAVKTANAQSQAAAKAPAAAPAQPQNQPQYKELRVADPKLKEWSDLATKKSDERIQNISNMLSGAAPLDQKALQNFLYTIVFPQFTRLDNIYAKKGVRGAPNLKATYCMLPDMRADFNRMFLQDATNAQAHEALVDLTLTAMNAIANDNYHPIARYNAMLLIAQLNQDAVSETPHPKALEILKGAARSENTIDAVRAAAMIGLVRHAKAGISDANSAGSLAGLLVQLLNDNKRPADRSQAGHDWMRRRALEALVAMYGQNPPANGYFVQLFDTLLADTSSTLEFRAEVVEAFLTSKFVAPKDFDSAKFAAGIGQVAVDAYHTELETTVRMGRKVYADGMTYYFNLVDKALAALDKAAPSPNIAKLQTALTELKDSTVLEELAFDAQPDPARELKLYDQIAKAGAELESVVTGKPVSDLLPKRGKVGGNSQAGMVGGGYGGGGYGGGRPGGGYGRPGGGYGAPSRGTGADRPGGGYGAPPRGNFGGAR